MRNLKVKILDTTLREGELNSGVYFTSTHIWNEAGNYEIKVKAKDIHGIQSEWSDPLVVSMPKYKIYSYFKIEFIF